MSFCYLSPKQIPYAAECAKKCKQVKHNKIFDIAGFLNISFLDKFRNCIKSLAYGYSVIGIILFDSDSPIQSVGYVRGDDTNPSCPIRMMEPAPKEAPRIAPMIPKSTFSRLGTAPGISVVVVF